MEELKFIAALGWSLLVISPFVWRMIFNWMDERDAEKFRPYDSMWDMYLDEFEDDED